MKLIKQHDERDCGAACLSMVASHFGLHQEIYEYRKLTKTDRNGTNLYGLVDAASKIGLKSEALSGDINELMSGISDGTIRFPFIAHTITEDGMQHFIVVSGLKNNRFIVADPAKGKCRYSIEDFSEKWTEYIVTFEKTSKFKEGNYKTNGFRKFFSLLQGQYKLLAGVIIISFVISIIGIMGAFVFESVLNNFYDNNTAEICEDGCTEDHEHISQEDIEESNILDKAVGFITDNADNFSAFFIMLIFLYILQAFIQFARGWLLSLLSKNIDVKLMLSYYNHLIGLPMAAVVTRNTGEYLSRFSDASAIRNAVSGATLTLILDSVMAIACGVFLYLENDLLFYVSLIMIIMYAIVVIIYRKPLETANRHIMEDNARVESFLKESIDGISTVKSNQAEALIKEKNTSKFTSLMKSVFHGNVMNASQDSICDMIELIGTAVILWIGFGMVLSNVITVGSLITFYALLSYFSTPLKNVINLQPTIQTAKVAADRLNDILNIEKEKNEQKSADFDFKTIKAEHIDFRYSNHELTLKDISLTIKKGEKIAIIGESGSGKTTLAKLLLGFYEPEKGNFYLDDINFKNIGINSLRNMIAYVDQDTFLFSDTIKNNLLVANPEASEKEIEEVFKAANIDELINNLPFGYDTYLDENGLNLSGGQRQRLSIARALLRKPKILILDEATSNLDTITENGIKNTVFHLNDDLTCIIIAHRLNTIKDCDRVIVMEHGRIAEVGIPSELINQKGVFYKYFKEYI